MREALRSMWAFLVKRDLRLALDSLEMAEEEKGAEVGEAGEMRREEEEATVKGR